MDEPLPKLIRVKESALEEDVLGGNYDINRALVERHGWLYIPVELKHYERSSGYECRSLATGVEHDEDMDQSLFWYTYEIETDEEQDDED